MYALSRTSISFNDKRLIYHFIDVEDQHSIEESAISIPNNEHLDYISVSTGFLSNNNVVPEKSIKKLSYEKFNILHTVRDIGPALIAKDLPHKLIKCKN